MLLSLTRRALRRPNLWLGAVAVLTLLLAAGLSRLEVQTDGAALYPRDDGVVERTVRDRAAFGDPPLVLLLVASRPGGPPVAGPQGFTFLKSLHETLRRTPGVRASGLRSLANLPELAVRPDALELHSLLEHVPAAPGPFRELLVRTRRHPWTSGLLLSADGKAAALYVPVAAGADRHRILVELRRQVETWRRGPFQVSMTGPVVAETLLGDAVLADLARLVPLMLAVMALLLWIQLRTVGGVLVPLIEVGVVVVWTLGAMAWSGVPLTLVTTLLPVLLMALGITDEIHVLERLQDHLRSAVRAGRALDRKLVAECMAASLEELHGPVVAASATTALGFLAFPFSSVGPLRDFGVFSTLGFLVSMGLSFSLVPAVAVRMPPRWLLRPLGPARRGEGGLSRLETWAVRKPAQGLAVGGLLVALAVPGLLRLEVADNWIRNFDRDSEVVTAERAFNRAFWGTYRLDVVMAGPPGLFLTARGFSLLEQVEELGRRQAGIGGVLSAHTPVAEVAKAFGEKERLASLPDERLADFANLATVSEDPFGLGHYVSSDGSTARVQMLLKSEDYRRDRRLTADLQQALAQRLQGVRWHLSGDIPSGIAMVKGIVGNELRSIGWTLGTIALLLLLMARSRGWAALAILAPVSAATLLVFAGMGYAGIALGVATSMFASLTLGTGIDFAVHVVHEFRAEREKGLDEREAMAATLARTGRALRGSATVLGLGFLVLTASGLRPNRGLGFLLAGAMAASYAMTLLLAPGLAARWVKVQEPAKRAAAAAALLFLITALPASALAADRPKVDATALMARVEERFRAQPRAVRLDVTTKRTQSEPIVGLPPHEELRLWGVTGGGERFQSLFVFFTPQRWRGTGLLFQDAKGSERDDHLFYHMRTFRRFQEVPATSLRYLVTGTCITYEEARGFLAGDRYTFQAAGSSGGRVRVLARPRTAELASQTGYSALEVEVDEARALVTKILFRDLSGQLAKTYEAAEPEKVGEVWLPRRARFEDVQGAVVSEVRLSYWPLPQESPAGLFSVEVEEQPLLDRLNDYLRKVGIKAE